MDTIKQFIYEIKDSNENDPKPSLIQFIDKILFLSGPDGLSLASIYSYVEEAGYKYEKSVIRSNINRNTTTSNYKHSKQLWVRKAIGNYVSTRYPK